MRKILLIAAVLVAVVLGCGGGPEEPSYMEVMRLQYADCVEGCEFFSQLWVSQCGAKLWDVEECVRCLAEWPVLNQSCRQIKADYLAGKFDAEGTPMTCDHQTPFLFYPFGGCTKPGTECGGVDSTGVKCVKVDDMRLLDESCQSVLKGGKTSFCTYDGTSCRVYTCGKDFCDHAGVGDLKAAIRTRCL
jgi:hypothetical protein